MVNEQYVNEDLQHQLYLILDLEKYGHKTLEKIPNMFDDMSFDILEETRGELIEMFRGENVDGGWSNASLDNVCYANLENAFEG